MNTEHPSDTHTNIPAAEMSAVDKGADAETRLQLKRDALRVRLAQQQDDPLGQVGLVARMTAPLARQMVRQHPYAALSGAALVGVWLIRGKPWRALGGSVLAGLLARQALSYSLASGNQLFKRLIARDRAKPTGRPL